MQSQTNMQRETSMLHWFPRIKDILPVPRTTFYVLTDAQVYEIIGLLDGKDLPDDLKNALLRAANQIGYPLFIRTDMGSAKHDYERSCCLMREADLFGHLACLIEWHLMRDLWPQAIAFRELLELNAPFKAFEGLPIAKERRYFVDEGKVLCHHPYWPAGAIEQGRNWSALPKDWETKLAEVNEEDEGEIACLTRMAESFAELIPGFFSVDFAQKANGGWVLIDAARGELSWHPEHEEAAR